MSCRVSLLLPLVVSVAAADCGSGFDPYNRLTSLRVLAIRAQSPTLAPGESTTLEALTYHPTGETLTYAWSWCLQRGGAELDYACAVLEEQISALLGGLPVSYDLGQGATAAFSHTIEPTMLEKICSTPLAPQQHDSSGIPDCTHGLPISIGLTVTAKGEEVTSFKTIYLALSSEAFRNRNPQIDAAYIAAESQERTDSVELVAGAPTFGVIHGDTYELFVDVPESAAEAFSLGGQPEERETLALTWFVEGGDTDSTRTSFIDGKVGLDDLEHNSWDVPLVEEFDGDEAALYFVLRDERGGVGWLSRRVRVAKP